MLLRRQYRSNRWLPYVAARISSTALTRRRRHSCQSCVVRADERDGNFVIVFPKNMSEQQMDSYDSRPVTSKKLGRPPFKLCFSKNQQTGRSNICISKTNGTSHCLRIVKDMPYKYTKVKSNWNSAEESVIKKIQRFCDNFMYWFQTISNNDVMLVINLFNEWFAQFFLWSLHIKFNRAEN